MADKRISQLVERVSIANNDVLPIVASGATTTNKVTISSIQTYMQENLDVGVTSVGITIGTSGTDVSVTGSPVTTSGNITINIPDASASARGVVTSGSQTFGGVKTFADGLSLPSLGGGNQITRLVNIGTLHQGTAGLNQIGFNSGNNIYFGKGLSNGGVISWNNSAVRYYTLQDADGTLAFTSQLDGYVTLDTAQTITAQKTFTTSGSSDTMIISHGSGSGFALDVIKAGDGEAIRVQKTSGSGNAVTITGGLFSAEASAFSGNIAANDGLTLAAAGTADPTILRNTSGTTSSTTASNVIGFNGTNNIFVTTESRGGFILGFNNSVSNREYTLPDASGTIALTTDLGAYLPLTGGTLTGALNGTSASFTGDVGVGASTLTNPNSLGRLIEIKRNEPVGLVLFDSRDANPIGLENRGAVFYLTYGTSNILVADGASGVVGIGVNSGNGKLFVKQSNANLYDGINNYASSNDSFLGIGHTGSLAVINSSYNTTGVYAPLAFYTSDTERMRITSGGFLKASNDGTYGSSTGLNHEFTTNQGGNYGLNIRNTHPSAPFGLQVFYPNTINDTSNRFIDCEDNTAIRFSVRSNGGLANYQANDVNLSDERTKKDIEPLESYWDKFKAIEIVKFKYKDQTHDDFNIGVIAQQVEAVAPEFVDIDGWNTKPELDEEGNEIVSEEEPLKSIYTADLHHATIKVLQEAMAKIEELQIQIDSLKNQIK